jgi:hypothetical protein
LCKKARSSLIIFLAKARFVQNETEQKLSQSQNFIIPTNTGGNSLNNFSDKIALYF